MASDASPPAARVPRLLVRLITAAFDAPYSATALPRCPATEAVLTIAPVSPAAIRRFATHCEAKYGTRRLTDIVSSNWSGGVSSQSFPGW